jgi:phage repressor protein C with HTH and peptisase S24 domain
MSEKLIRIERLRQFMRSKEWKPIDVARALDVQPSYVYGLLSAKSAFAEKAARNIEEKLGLPRFFLDDRDAPHVKTTAESHRFVEELQRSVTDGSSTEYAGPLPIGRRVPVVGMAKLGDDGYYEEISDIPGVGDGFVEVISSDKNAFALRVRGDSMFPAIRDGWIVVVSPNGTPAPEEYVAVGLANGKKMVKELINQRPDSVALLSINGGARMNIARDEIAFIYPIVNILPPSAWKP